MLGRDRRWLYSSFLTPTKLRFDRVNLKRGRSCWAIMKGFSFGRWRCPELLLMIVGLRDSISPGPYRIDKIWSGGGE